jgi:hypothetical protein
MQAEDHPQRLLRPDGERVHQEDRDDRQRKASDLDHRLGPHAGSEGEDERRQVERQRDDPQQRHRGQVARDEGRRPEHQARRHGRERQPAQPVARADRPLRRRAGLRLGGLLARAQPERDGAGRHEQRAHHVSRGPGVALVAQREPRLDDERIGQQTEQAAAVRGGE